MYTHKAGSKPALAAELAEFRKSQHFKEKHIFNERPVQHFYTDKITVVPRRISRRSRLPPLEVSKSIFHMHVSQVRLSIHLTLVTYNYD